MLLSQAIDLHIADKRAKGYKAATIRSATIALRHLLRATGNVPVQNLSPQHIDTLFAQHPEWGAATFNLNRTHLKVFFKWCRSRGYMGRDTDPLDGVRTRVIPQRKWTIIPQHEFATLLDAAENPRDRALIAIGLYLFTRPGETATLTWGDVDFQNDTISVYRIKTDTLDHLPMCVELANELKRWHLAYGEMMGELPRRSWRVCPPYEPPRFTGTSQSQFTMIRPAMLQPTKILVAPGVIVRNVLEKTGWYNEHDGGHTLRRSGAVAFYNELIDRGHDGAIRTVQAMLGHKTVLTTERYLQLDQARKTRNDLLAGKPMFKPKKPGNVIALER